MTIYRVENNGRPPVFKGAKGQVFCVDCMSQLYLGGVTCDGCDESVCHECRTDVLTEIPDIKITTRWCKTCWGIVGDEDFLQDSKVIATAPIARIPNKHTKRKSMGKKNGVVPRVKRGLVVNTHYQDYQRLAIGDPFHIEASPDIYVEFLNHLMTTQWVEIAGEFYWDEDENQITWVSKIRRAQESPGHVNSWSAESTIECLAAVGKPPNGQWHTHPGFSAFHSGEDKTNMMEFSLDALKITPTGYHIFLVHNGLHFNVCRIDWADGKLTTRRMGNLVSNGVKMAYRAEGARRWSKKNNKKRTKTHTQHDTWRPNHANVHHSGQLMLPAEAEAWLKGMDDEEIDTNWIYRGWWASEDHHYRRLFEMMKVKAYDWPELHKEIGAEWGYKYYRDIVDHPDMWQRLMGVLEYEQAEQQSLEAI